MPLDEYAEPSWKNEPYSLFGSGVDLGEGYWAIGLDPEDGEVALYHNDKMIYRGITPDCAADVVRDYQRAIAASPYREARDE